ncbi:MAG: hypothetical protein KIT82_03545 [Bradyrhizobium sp.]|nr:hypothetical protein [Bradyrhizobium sp.]
MKRPWLRRILTPLLGLVFAVSMSAATVQASDMAARMAMASGMGVAHEGKCPDCGGGSSGMKASGCSSAICAAQIVAVPSQEFVALRIRGADVPAFVQPSLVDWLPTLDPYPPRPSALG